MAEEVRCYVMKTMAANKLKLAGHIGALTPMQQSRLDKEKRASNGWTPIWSGDGDGLRYEVQSFYAKVDVNLSTHTCTCRFWQLTGMPCCHAITAIACKNEKPEDYCHGWLTMGSYNATYQYFVQPTQGEIFWEKTDYDKPAPPPIKRAGGRPKKARRKDGNEGSVQNNRLKRSYPECICSRCGHPNHNIRNCMNYGVPPKPRGWKPVETTEVPASEGDGTSTPINLTTATKNFNETQTEIDLSQSQPTSQSSQPQPVHTNQGLPPTPNQPVVSAEPTQTTRVAPMSQVRPNTPFRQPSLIHTIAARPTYRGSTRRKLSTRGGGLSFRPHAGGPRQNASSSPTTAANQTSAASPFVGGNSSTRPSTISPTSAAGPYLGPSSSSRPTTISPTAVAGPFQGASASSPINFRPRGTAGPSSAAGPFQGASASTCNRFMQFMPTPGFHPPPPKKP